MTVAQEFLEYIAFWGIKDKIEINPFGLYIKIHEAMFFKVGILTSDPFSYAYHNIYIDR